MNQKLHERKPMNPSCKLTEDEKKILRARFVMQAHRELLRAFSTCEQEGLTRVQLADNLGIDKSVVSRRLNGSSNMTLEIISDMARGMGFRPEIKLLSYEDLTGANYAPLFGRERLFDASTPARDYSSVSGATINKTNVVPQ